jgi:hypothetical protein
MRDFIALPVFYAVSRAPMIASLMTGIGLVVLLTDRGGMPLPEGLAVLAFGFVGAFGVGLACSVPVLRTTDGGHRTLQDACWEVADEIGTWAGWEDWEDESDSSVQ